MRRLNSYILPLLLVLITVCISVLNYTPGTFLTGWDTLHPEFNFPQQFSNIFFGVFRSDQGLGAIAAHSHMSELPRILFLYLESFLLPLSFLRYSYIYLCFILGPLGIYFLLKKVLSMQYSVSSTTSHNTHYSILNTSLAAFIGALIYIFNLGTVQHFYVPFEMFTTQYAALGWLFLATILVLQKRSLKHIAFLSVVLFFSSSMAYASVLWYAYFACMLLFLFVFCILKRSKKVILSSLLVVLITLIINSYWILPNLYFLTTTAKEVSLAQTNKIFSDEAFLHNKQYGNLTDTAILKNFLFNWTSQVNVNTSEDLLSSWKYHLSIPGIIFIGYAVFLLCLSGIILSVIQKNKTFIAFIPVFIASFIMLMNMNPPFDSVFGLLRDNFTLFREGLRFPFTKFSLLLMLSLSLFSGYAFLQILNAIQHASRKLPVHLKAIYMQIGIIVIAAVLLIAYGFPMFQGELISKKMRISIPSEYFQLFSYLQKQPIEGRIAPLPVHSLWGWEYYEWPASPNTIQGGGYQGAGFLWFGAPQSVLARDFDRWNSDNEQYYREISEALYSRDHKKVEAVARKYKIHYFLLDENVIFPGNKQNALWHHETKTTFADSKNIKLVKKFGDGLFLYEVGPKAFIQNVIQAPEKIITVGPKVTGGFVDLAYYSLGDYVLSENPAYFYPARSLVNRYERIDPEKIEIKNGELLLSLPEIPNSYEFTTSFLDRDIFPEFMRTYNVDTSQEEFSVPYLIGQSPFITTEVSSASSEIVDKIVQSNECGSETPNTKSSVTVKSDYVQFMSQKGASCGFVNFPLAKQDFGNVLKITARNITGLPIRLCVTNKLTRRCDLYTTLDSGNSWKDYYFMIPPQPSGDSGYAVNFNTVSIGNDRSVNDVKSVEFIQIPYYRIQNLYFIPAGTDKSAENGIKINSYKNATPVNYLVDISKNNKPGLIAFYKAFDSGWKAYVVDVKGQTSKVKSFQDTFFPFISGKEIKNHVNVNNWANGWITKPAASDQRLTTSISIIFLPQYLEYAGFIMLAVYTGTLSGIALQKGIRRGIKHYQKGR